MRRWLRGLAGWICLLLAVPAAAAATAPEPLVLFNRDVAELAMPPRLQPGLAGAGPLRRGDRHAQRLPLDPALGRPAGGFRAPARRLAGRRSDGCAAGAADGWVP